MDFRFFKLDCITYVEPNVCFRHVLITDGRGWTMPSLPPGQVEKDGYGRPEPQWTFNKTAKPEMCAGGVDIPFDLSNNDSDLPVFDNSARPNSLAVPLRHAHFTLFNVQSEGCHRALFDFCQIAAAQLRSAVDPDDVAESGVYARALLVWMKVTVGPLLKAANGHWYPVLWGATEATRRLAETLAQHDEMKRRWLTSQFVFSPEDQLSMDPMYFCVCVVVVTQMVFFAVYLVYQHNPGLSCLCSSIEYIKTDF